MKTLISFREGLSGHYLRKLIFDSTENINFRVDPFIPNVPQQIQHQIEIQKKYLGDNYCVCMHPKNINTDIDFNIEKNFDLILTIQVYKKIYNALYNNFHKKLLIDNSQLQTSFQTWHENKIFWYDLAYYNIKEYYELYQRDLIENTFPNIINFDLLLDIDYIQHIFQKYLNRSINNNTRLIVEKYSNLQLKLNLPNDEKDMKDIVGVLPDNVFVESPWFASYCIFKFEKNNNLSELQRRWQIDSIDNVIDQKFLLKISDQYN